MTEAVAEDEELEQGIVLDFSNAQPHAGQQRVLQSVAEHDVTVLAPGRQWGKSSIRPFWIVDTISRTLGFCTLAYMGPAHSDAKKAFDEDLFNLGGAGLVLDHGGDDQDRHIDYRAIVRDVPGEPPQRPNEGARVYYVSGGGEAHRLFQKHKLHGAFLDEFSHMPMEAWIETISPMFNTTGGHALIVGTPIPDGINFAGFADIFTLGDPRNENRDPAYNSISGRSEENPYALIEQIARRRAYLARIGRSALARCLYDGEFVTEMGAVFENLDATFSLRGIETSPGLWISRPPSKTESICVGIDLGKHGGSDGDPTVATAFSRTTNEQLGLLRIEHTDYTVQLPILDRFIRTYGTPMIWVDARSGGEMVTELMRRQYGNVCNLVRWTQGGGPWEKNKSVVSGMDFCERAAWRLMNVPWQREEFSKYSREKSPSGVWKYGAPKGKHDDAVTACLMAAYGLPLDPVVAPADAPKIVPSYGDLMERHYSEAYKAIQGAKEVVSANPFVLRRRA